MAIIRIFGPEASQSSAIDFGAILEGVELRFSLEWLDRPAFWTLTVTDTRQNEILRGIRVPGGTDMFYPYSTASGLPPGKLVAYDTQGVFAAPGRNDWRERHLLVYQDSEPETEEVPLRIIEGFIPPPV